MKHDADFFVGLAQISERVAATALDHLCAQENRAAIEGFMDAVLRNPELFPDTLSNKKLPLLVSTAKIENEPNMHQSVFDLIAMTIRTQTPETPFTEDRLDHFAKILDFAAGLPATGFNPFQRLAGQLSKFSADPTPVQMLIEAAEAAGQTLKKFSMVATAMGQNNHGAVVSLVASMNDQELMKAMPELVETITVTCKPAIGNWAWSLARAEPNSPEYASAHTLFNTLDERAGVYAIAPLRLALMASHLSRLLGTDEAMRADDFFAFAGLQAPDQAITESLVEAMDAWHNKDPVAAQEFVHCVVQANLVELLPAVGGRIKAHGDVTRLETTVGTALDGAFVWADGPEGVRRLKDTLAYMDDLGHDLNDFGNGESPMTHIALNRRPGRLKTLAVLLDLGFDPAKEDSRGRLAVKHMTDDAVSAWNHVVNAHKARSAAHTLLNEIDLSP